MKNKILFLLIGLQLILPNFVSAAFDWSLGISGKNFSVGMGSGSGESSGVMGGLGAYGLPGGSLFGIIENILFWLLAVLGIVAIIGFIISGLLYLTAAGDEEQSKRAKRAMTYSIIGVIVGLAGVVVVQAVNYMLQGYGTF